MDVLIRTVMTLGPPVFGLALILLLSLGAGLLAFAVGMAAGIFISCSVENPGNLCGLAGVFGMGPLLSGVVVAGVAYVLSRNAKRVP